MNVLGIDTSCDDTGIGIVDDRLVIHANVVASQVDLHARTGGVVPEVAARKHLEVIVPLFEETLRCAHMARDDIHAIAVTNTHGLVGCLLVGVGFGKALAFSLGVPLIGVHHIEGHIYAPILQRPSLPFPHLCLTAAGGHTSLIAVDGHHSYRILGETLDDAAGEVLDKAARAMGLPFPGGPVINKLSLHGDPASFHFPRPLSRSRVRNFSFSGLKTHFLRQLREVGDVQARISDLAASLQEAVIATLIQKTIRAALEERLSTITLTGGVAANTRLRSLISKTAERYKLTVCLPGSELCGDNGAMIAAAGLLRLRDGLVSGLDLDVRSTGDLA